MIWVKFKKLNEKAKEPTKAHEGDIGYDLYANEAVMIPPGERRLVGTGIAIQIDTPVSGYFRIAPKSGLAVAGIDVGAGVVDQSYSGEIKVLLINNGKNLWQVIPGYKIAQLIFEFAMPMQFREVQELLVTTRGANGFGSSGLT